MPDLAEAVILAVIVFAVLFAGLTALSGFDGEVTEDGTQRTGEVVLLDGTGQYTEIDDELGDQQTVYNSLGWAVNLTGADDSYVESDAGFDISSDDTWTVSVGARVDSDAAPDTMTAVSVNGRLLINYNGSQGNWTAWYYDEGGRDSHVVNVSATEQPGNLSTVQVRSNGTHLAIYRDNTEGDVKNITVDNISPAPIESTNWNGRLDELRTFDDALDSSQRQQLVYSPVAPLKATNRTARVMFDERDKNSQTIFFTNTRMTQSNVSFSDGHPGSVMDGQTLINQITGSTDYVWDDEGPRIYVVEGGELDEAPVAYIDYTYYPFGGTQQDFADKLGRAIGLAGFIPTILLLVIIVGYLMVLRD